jgi:hypothetical protein
MPDALNFSNFMGLSLLDILRSYCFKAYYIVWAFMHMEGENQV